MTAEGCSPDPAVALSPHTRLGPYETLEPIGAGGMGEVYRARDTRLDRLVAVKVLRAKIATDPHARARFEREARTIAALNHPNICAVHDVGHDSGRDFLVMELLEGQTLHQRLAKGPLTITELVDLGISLADALDTAHNRGILHRDLKPANVFLTSRGQPKILDFGVAKIINAFDDTAEWQANADLTAPGAAPGTIAYMSPEQLEGESLDPRTDLFSLGLVLYEMATGRRAFGGRSSADISAAILAKDPESPRELRPDLPAGVEDAILKALHKDRELRCQTAAELRADLRRVKAQFPAAAPPLPTPTPRAKSTTPAPTSSDAQIVADLLKRHPLGAAVVGLAVVGALAAVTWVSRAAPANDRVGSESFPNLEIQALTVNSGARFPAISPDGRFVAYTRGTNSVWVRQTAVEHEVEVVPAVPGRQCKLLSFTPDGTAIDFVATDKDGQNLWRVPLLGGTPTRLINNVWSAAGWSHDGRHMAFIRTSGSVTSDTSVVVADADGAHERTLVTRRQPLMFVNATAQFTVDSASRPAWALDDATLLLGGISFAPDRVETLNEMVTLDVASGRELRAIPLRRPLFQAFWLDPSRILAEAGAPGTGSAFVQSIWSVDPEGTEWTSVTKDFAVFQNVTLTADRRTAVAQRTESRTGIWLGDGTGEKRTMIADEHLWGPDVPLVDDFGNVFYLARNGYGSYDVYRLPIGEAKPTMVVTKVSFFSIVHDGSIVVFTGAEPPYPLCRVDAHGMAMTTLVARNGLGPTVMPDGRSVLYSPIGPGVYSVPIDGGAPRKVTDQVAAWGQSVSADGRRILFANGKPRVVVVCDLPGCANAREVEIQGSVDTAIWTPDGKGIASVFASNGERNIWVHPLDGSPEYAWIRHEPPGRIQHFSWSADGTRLVMSRGQWTDDIVLIKGLR